ncbi:HPr family phosphocarrier protein [Neobacillus drentensis]|uniref:HPr family phosphocarrier protein n=1 Tax=Neobacillus drentensis TaxID=220684 RepID=UPI001F2BF098|nr:HPr family phosphocarrier protein [Neobacillus drentensis]ULT58740.1 HPr family phosphocarrier protein [Neobacillus drentensis]
MREKKIVVNLQGGLQAYNATEFVKEATKYSSDIKILKDERLLAAKSIMGVMCLAIRKGEEITLIADGIDECKAIKSLEIFLTKG